MKCKELMVGDLVSHNEVPIQIIFVGNGYANYEDEEGGPCQLDDKYYPPEPIPLTPEILEKNGWKETQYCYEYRDYKNTIQCCLPDMIGRINGVEIENFECEYVHQYQHLLRLCGLDELADNFKV